MFVLLTVIKCVDPGEVVNATYTITGQYPGDTSTYKCSEGSTQKGGDYVRTCRANGTWDGQPIVCVVSGKYYLIYILSWNYKKDKMSVFSLHSMINFTMISLP